MKRIVIAGGGIAGLSIAHALRERQAPVEVIVLERSDRVGGNIRTDVVDGYRCEWGPDGFLDNAPATVKLAEAVGLGPRLQPSRDEARRRFIFRKGQLHEVPMSVGGFVRSRLLSARGKARLALEPLARRRNGDDETIHEFASRRIGDEAASVLIDSMVSGIFAGDSRALSLRACFPKMWQLETDHGGLVRALIATRRNRKKDDAVGAPAGRLTSFRDGMEELPAAVARALGDIVRTGTPVLSLRKGRQREAFVNGAEGFTVTTPHGTIDADAVVLTGPAAQTSALVAPFDSTLASLVGGIQTAPVAVVCLGYDEAAVTANRGPLNGFGFLVPRREGPRILGALWETCIYPNRAPDGKVLVRVIIGGAVDPEAHALPDDALLAIVQGDLARTMGLAVEPEFRRIIRHPRGIPQYTQGHVARLQRIDTLLKAHPGLYVAGNSYRGVAINSCIAEADAISDAILSGLASL